jgi:hypothetical protein
MGKTALATDSGMEVSDPFAYCERARTDDRMSGTASTTSEAAARILAPYLRAAFGWPAGAAPPAGSLFWRCMQGKVYVCIVGANLPCASKADRTERNLGADAYCRENPGAPDVPAFATGHETIYSWRCAAGKALRGAPIADLDRRGFRRDLWHVIAR